MLSGAGVPSGQEVVAMEGLWTAEFGSGPGVFGSGVAVFRDGKILGGDSTYYYAGDFALDGNALVATLRISPHVHGARSVFGTVGKDLILKISGSLTDENHAVAQGTADGIPGVRFGVKLTKRL